MLSPDLFLRKIAEFSANRVKLHGAYYTIFGVFGTIYYIVPYIIWSHSTLVEYQTLTLRLIACILCFYLIIYHQNILWNVNKSRKKNKSIFYNNLLSNKEESYNENSEHQIHQGFLPIYWHFTLCYCLPLMSSYNIFESGFKTTWVVSSSLSILILVLLVDWISFIFIMFIGVVLAYLIYSIWTGNLHLETHSDNLLLVIYIYFFSILIGAFFLYQKETMVLRIKKANDDLEKLNLTLDLKVKKRTKYLKQALKSRSEFLNNISHEVRTPLQGIMGISTTLVEHWNNLSEKERFSYIKVISDSGDRLMNLVSSLLDLSKFDSGKMLFEFELNDIVQIINDSIIELKPLSYSNNIDIKFLNLDNIESLYVTFDKQRILQVLRNFISNALKYSSNQEVKVFLDFSDEFGEKTALHDSNTILISVKDAGIGVPENELKTIFLPFSQSSRTKSKAGGSGLGLALSAEIIHAHKGKIWAYNNIGESGATFCFTLPMDEKFTNLKTKIQNKNLKEVDSNKNPSDFKILFVDDEEFCLMSGKVILECSGFNVTTCSGGYEALEFLEKEKFDLVFLDLMMPDLYGAEVLMKIKSSEKLKHIPVVLQSGASDNQEIAKTKSIGANGHIVKPYDKKVILSTINSILGTNVT